MSVDPKQLKYSREHEWISPPDGDGVAMVGITDYAQEELGDVVYVDLPEAGAKVTQFDKFGEVESVKSVSDLFSPVSGEVVESNAELKDKPELINQAPYGDGWMLKVRLTDRRELDSLLSLDEYEDFLKEAESH